MAVGGTGTDAICIESHNSSELEACRTESGQCGIRNRNASNTINACTTLNAVVGFDTTLITHTGIAKNNTTFGCTTDWDGTWSGTSNNNASEDGSHPGTSGVTITSDPFDVDGYTPESGGQLDGAGADLSISLDAANNSYNATPSIGAYESIGVDGFTIIAESGGYSYTGTDIPLNINRNIAAESGSYSVAGTDVNLTLSANLVVESGTYAVVGTDIPLRFGSTITAESGSYSVIGTSLGLGLSARMTTEPGSYIITGTDVTLSDSGNIWTDLTPTTTTWTNTAGSSTTWTDI